MDLLGSGKKKALIHNLPRNLDEMGIWGKPFSWTKPWTKSFIDFVWKPVFVFFISWKIQTAYYST